MNIYRTALEKIAHDDPEIDRAEMVRIARDAIVDNGFADDQMLPLWYFNGEHLPRRRRARASTND